MLGGFFFSKILLSIVIDKSMPVSINNCNVTNILIISLFLWLEFLWLKSNCFIYIFSDHPFSIFLKTGTRFWFPFHLQKYQWGDRGRKRGKTNKREVQFNFANTIITDYFTRDMLMICPVASWDFNSGLLYTKRKELFNSSLQ